MKKDQEQTERIKSQTINEIKSWDKSKMFEAPKKKKTSFFTKLLIVFGYGKKG